eukprot:TRINITY_DN9324_c0_g1_i1.p2 TRINITY_DN9324_c0_g1~~TRINITY_DN9324_c0_g1_i1.p2  ORF type:complete len:229 (-),score=26.46 TRINITY_DN9324_c0_g1_i1:541-1227(-)
MPPLLKLRTQAVVGHSGKHVLAAESIGTGEWASGRLQQHQYYTVILQRPARFYSLGMVIAKTADNRGILICAVNGGLAGDWNETAEHWQELQSEDVIVEVNGITGHSEELLRRCREDMTLELRVQRTGGPGSSSERAAAAACGFMVPTYGKLVHIDFGRQPQRKGVDRQVRAVTMVVNKQFKNCRCVTSDARASTTLEYLGSATHLQAVPRHKEQPRRHRSGSTAIKS